MRTSPSVPRRRGHAPRTRRGATLVMVALFSVVLVGMAAFAIDVSRLYVGVNELQTGADATALNGALQLQRNPAADGRSTTATFGGNNQVMGMPLALTASNIESGIWNPTTRVFTAQSWTSATTNAVRVSANSTSRLLFGGMLARGDSTPTRRAIAWVANVNGVDCIKPWGISRSLLETRHGIDLTTQAGVNTLRTLLNTTNGPAQLTVVLSPNVNAGTGGNGNSNGNGNNGNGNNGNSGNGGGPVVTAPTDSYQAITGDGNASPNSYEALITGTGCGNNVAEFPVNTLFQQPGQGNQVAQRADAIVRQTTMESGPCKKGTTARDATCYDPSFAGYVAGPTIILPLTVPAATPNRTQIVMLTKFRLMCAFTDDPPGNPLGPSPENCPWLQTIGQTATGYRRGTIVGYPVAGPMDLGNGTVLGNTISVGQRLILVQ
jgi:Flp pilus assembly protein TadG